MRAFLKRLFCKHEYKWQIALGYSPINGQEYLLRCPKCGKIKERRWQEFD